MVDTAFDRAERGLGSTDLSVADIVAKTRGNPNEIMKLVMAGQINLTQGLLAKRLSDSVVAEQQKAAAPTTTVLQDSFPQLAPPPAMGGLQPHAAPMAPAAPQGMGPVAPQMQAPQGMAEGGLAQLDFAAPDYAGGGIVAFAEGDELDTPEEWGAYFERTARESVPGVNVTSRRRTAARNAQVGGQPDSYHLLGAARDFTPPQGMTMRELASQLRSTFGAGYDIINEGDHVHVEPGPALGRAVRAGTPFNPANVSRLRIAENAPAAAAAPAAPAANPTAGYTPPDLAAMRSAALGGITSASPRQTEASQAYMERLRQAFNPEQERSRAEVGALFQAIGNVRPGMNPLEALAQGFATSGASMQAAEERLREQEMAQLRAAAELERLENQMSREELALAQQYALAQAGLLEAAEARRVNAEVQALDRESRERVAQWNNAAAMERTLASGEAQVRASERAGLAAIEKQETAAQTQAAADALTRATELGEAFDTLVANSRFDPSSPLRGLVPGTPAYAQRRTAYIQSQLGTLGVTGAGRTGAGTAESYLLGGGRGTGGGSFRVLGTE